MIGFGIVIAVVGIAFFYFKVYQKWEYRARFGFKIVMIYLTLIGTFFGGGMAVWSVGDVLENEQSKLLASRLEFAKGTAEKNDYAWLAGFMEYDQDYEEEFEYLWERLVMYESSLQYRIYSAADDAGLGEEYAKGADKYEAMMVEYCTNPTYKENAPYGELFMEYYNE